MITPDDLSALLPDYLAHQRWYAGDNVGPLTVREVEVLRAEPWPALLWAIADVDGVSYQLLLGARPEGEMPAFLHGHEHEVLGLAESTDGKVLLYEAVLDSELAIAFLNYIAPELGDVKRVRPISAEQSNSSVVYDERYIAKLLRKVSAGGNPDVEVTTALADSGFIHVARPLAVWRRAETDLAVVQEFLAGAVDGWALALTSLRDLYEMRCDPSECGGDFAAEAERLGQVTAALHIALAEAFGDEPGDVNGWAALVESHVGLVDTAPVPASALGPVLERFRRVEAPGRAIRVHGDYHLAQVIRSDAGWHVLDFEGEPLRTPEERRLLSSPLKDVAGMLRSFHYASAVALREQLPEDHDVLEDLAAAWDERNRNAFLAGYLATAGIDRLLPEDTTSQLAILAAYELEKAAYELDYERAHRPDWSVIPIQALARLASG